MHWLSQEHAAKLMQLSASEANCSSQLKAQNLLLLGLSKLSFMLPVKSLAGHCPMVLIV